MSEFEPGSDREHCRLDLHKIMDARHADRLAIRAWFAKWGAKVDTFLRDGKNAEDAEEIEGLNEEVRDVQSALGEEETSHAETKDELKDVRKGISDALDALHEARNTDALEILEAL